jgi:hypothetical protein
MELLLWALFISYKIPLSDFSKVKANPFEVILSPSLVL